MNLPNLLDLFQGITTLLASQPAIIACAVRTTLGDRAQVTAVSLVPPHAPSVEALMLQWSLEGRRQIYTSHKVR